MGRAASEGQVICCSASGRQLMIRIIDPRRSRYSSSNLSCFYVPRSSSVALHRLHDDVWILHRLRLDPVRSLRGAKSVSTLSL